MSETMDPPTVEPASRTEVAVAAAGAVDLAKVDIHAVVRAQFAAGRTEAETTLKEMGSVVLDLSNQSKVTEAKSLRERRVNVPIADMRKLGKGQRSALSQAGKTSSAEEEAVVGIFAKAGEALTAQIDAAQAKIDAAKEAERQAKEAARKIEEARLQDLRDQIDAALAKWVALCGAEDITAARIGDGISKLEMVPTPEFAIEVAEHWRQQKAATLQAMDREKAAAVAREAAAAIEAQRLENERVAAENARIAAEAAAESARVAAAAAAEKAAAEALMEQARQMLAAAEAKREADEEIEAARLRAITPAANVATAAATEGTAETPEPQQLEAAPSHRTEWDRALNDAEAAAVSANPFQIYATPADAGPAPAYVFANGLTGEETAASASCVHIIGKEPPGIEVPMPTHAAILPRLPSDTVRDLKVLMQQARESRFPRQPKMPPEWFAAVYAAVDALAAEVAQ